MKYYEKELLIETINYRLDNDEDLFHSMSLKEDLEDLLMTLEEDDE